MGSKFVLFLLSLGLPFASLAHETNLRIFRFVEAKSVREKSGLPPQIEMTLEMMCNEEFVQLVRHEQIEPKTQKVTIALGAIVRESLISSCAGEKKKITVDAGTAFSGRSYEISRIKR